MSSLRILVTGGAGFVGSHSAERLAKAGHEVVAFDNLSTGKRENLLGLDIPLIEGDVRDYEALSRVLSGGFDAVLHLAAVVSVPLSVQDPIGSHETNAKGTLHVLEACRRHGVNRVVYASSAAIYGDQVPPLSEALRSEGLSPYAAQKYANEVDAGVYARLFGLETIGLRYFNIFGPRQDPKSPYSGVLSIFVDALKNGQAPTIFGDGGQTRDFVYVGDIAQANQRALEAPSSLSGEVFNVGTGTQTSVLEAYGAIAKALGLDLTPRFGPPREGDILHSGANIEKITRLLAYRPEMSFAEGIRHTVSSLVPAL
ncbi:NAD-dependent epimerase/dehydratase family protein [bacterium]|nr:NAD-dependent epimerase/dehydratase family protein [bacterium]